MLCWFPQSSYGLPDVRITAKRKTPPSLDSASDDGSKAESLPQTRRRRQVHRRSQQRGILRRFVDTLQPFCLSRQKLTPESVLALVRFTLSPKRLGGGVFRYGPVGSNNFRFSAFQRIAA